MKKFEFMEIEGEWSPGGEDAWGRDHEGYTLPISIKELDKRGREGWRPIWFNSDRTNAILQREYE